ncbi:hypothetical protein [Isoptericola sp. b408]|uniref:hypothetical protein n=1 Tax=Isoptericola sp. b408 TaxID=3064653 RepID=UPI0027125DD1|nr:hypothetical protein [Isoptericola sp. b408]MDO8150852.1 hypothetical protein [Isoptericola sp. b408]
MGKFELMLTSPIRRALWLVAGVLAVLVSVYAIGGGVLRAFGPKAGRIDVARFASEIGAGSVEVALVLVRIRAQTSLIMLTWGLLLGWTGILGPAVLPMYDKALVVTLAFTGLFCLWAVIEGLFAWPSVLVPPEGQGTPGYLAYRRRRDADESLDE